MQHDNEHDWEELMSAIGRLGLAAHLRAGVAAVVLAGASSGGLAADVTFERLLNPEPQNWLMNHHDYSSQRYSALNTINRDNVKNLKLASSVALGGTSANEYVEAKPL